MDSVNDINKRLTKTQNVLPVFGLFLIAVLFVSSLFFNTALAMFNTWIGSETYNHCLFVLPAFLYFVWINRNQIHTLPEPTLLGVFPVVLSGFIWLLGAIADISLVMQFGFVSMLISLTCGLFGVKLTKQFLFPIGFLFLAVPFGEELLPVMIEFTATFTVGMLKMMGYPVFREGTYFSLPTGNWSVVEACSGVRYLIASVTMGLIYAYITYTSLLKRSVFVLVSIIVPIIANGLRAVMIVLLGHYSGMTIATGVDHLVYGWLFFGVIIFILFWIGSFWRDDFVDEKQVITNDGMDHISTKTIPNYSRLLNTKNGIICLLLFVSLAIWPLWLNWLLAQSPKENPVHQLQLSENYQRCEDCKAKFQPSFSGADHVVSRTYLDDKQREISVYIASYYSWKKTGELISYKNQLVLPSDDNYRIIKTGKGEQYDYAKIKGSENYLVANWYLVNQDTYTNKVMVKIIEATQKLFGNFLVSQYVAIFVEEPDSETAREVIDELLVQNRILIDSNVQVPNE